MTDTDNPKNNQPDEEKVDPIIHEPSPEYEKEEGWESEIIDTTEEKIEQVDETLIEAVDETAAKFDNTEAKEEKAESREIPTTIPMTTNEERTWAMLAHLSVLLNLVTGFLGGVAALVIYFVYKDRSRFVAYHAMQAFIFQSITWIGAGLVAAVLITIGSVLAFLIIPLLCLIPGFLALLLIPASLIYGVIGGVQVSNGEDFRYWQVGDWVRDILEPKPVTEDIHK